MPRVIDIPGLGEVEFPDEMSPEQVNSKAKELYDGAALSGSLKKQGFNQEPPQEEFLSKFRNMGSLLGGAMSTPQGAVMSMALPGVGAIGRAGLLAGIGVLPHTHGHVCVDR